MSVKIAAESAPRATAVRGHGVTFGQGRHERSPGRRSPALPAPFAPLPRHDAEQRPHRGSWTGVLLGITPLVWVGCFYLAQWVLPAQGSTLRGRWHDVAVAGVAAACYLPLVAVLVASIADWRAGHAWWTLLPAVPAAVGVVAFSAAQHVWWAGLVAVALAALGMARLGRRAAAREGHP